MIIDFTNRLTEAKVQEMINYAMDFTTGVINLSKASAEEIISAFTDPDRWLCAIDWSGETYLEQERRTLNTGSVQLSFYVIGASADTFSKKIYDRLLSATVTPSTGEVYISSSGSHFVPNIIYDLDCMNAEQLKRLAIRVQRTTSAVYTHAKEFYATWTYNGKRYNASVGYNSDTLYPYLMGTALDITYHAPEIYNDTLEIYYDRIVITNQGTIIHTEYASNIALTLVNSN